LIAIGFFVFRAPQSAAEEQPGNSIKFIAKING